MKRASRPQTSLLRITEIMLVIAIFFILAACTPQNQLPDGPTPIPTLIPVTVQPGSLQPTEIFSPVIESYPAGLPSAMAGQSLYGEHCASCHGVDGNGVVPNARDFGDVDYMRGETPANFYIIVTEGRGADMPAFGEDLTSDERWNIVYYVWHFSTTEAVLKEGNEIYVDSCASCHGEDGRSLILGAANLTDHRFMANQSPSQLYVVVTQGQGSMPAWQARLSQDERWAVIDYIRAFTYDPKVGEAATVVSTEIPISEEMRPECASYVDQSNPFDWNNADAVAKGQTLYNSSCSSCHGEDGTGRLPGILDFTDPITHADIRSNPAKYICSIAEGYQRMPSYKNEFTTDVIWELLVGIAALGD